MQQCKTRLVKLRKDSRCYVVNCHGMCKLYLQNFEFFLASVSTNVMAEYLVGVTFVCAHINLECVSRCI